MWDGLSVRAKLILLEGATTVPKELLAENSALVAMLKRGDSEAACLAFVNENW